MELLGILIVIVADIYLLALLLRLVLEPRMFYFGPILGTLRQATDPLLRPLERALPSRLAAAAVAILLVLVAKGLLLGLLGLHGFLVTSPATAFMARARTMPLIAGVLMSIQYVADYALAIALISLVVSLLLEPYTVNPLSRFAFRVVETGRAALGPLGQRSEAQSKAAFGVAAVLLNAVLATVLMVLLDALSGGGVPLLREMARGLYSALNVGIEKTVGFFTLLLIVGALMSWFSPDPRNPLVQFIGAVSYPILAPFRRYIPPIAGIDISPIFAILLLGATGRVVVELLARMFGMFGPGFFLQ